jgi:hypothetical protein
MAMRERYAAGESQAALSSAYGSPRSVVSRIVTGLLYRHAGGPIAAIVSAMDRGSRIGRVDGGRKLTNAQARLIRVRHAAGDSAAALAHEYGVSAPTLGALLRGSTYRTAGGPMVAPVAWHDAIVRSTALLRSVAKRRALTDTEREVLRILSRADGR